MVEQRPPGSVRGAAGNSRPATLAIVKVVGETWFNPADAGLMVWSSRPAIERW